MESADYVSAAALVFTILAIAIAVVYGGVGGGLLPGGMSDAKDFSFGNGAGHNDSGRYNVILITVDSLRRDHMGVYGYDRNTTPSIDELSRSSAVFLNAYSHASWTNPSLASIHTGMHPIEHGVTTWRDTLNSRETTLAEAFKSGGYHTMAFVGHYLLTASYGYGQGFDSYDYAVLENAKGYRVLNAREMSDKVLNALDRNGAGPFFVWVHYFDPHYLYLTHEGFSFGGREVDNYDGEIAYTDSNINRLFEGLKARGLYDKTIIVLAADHGDEFGDHGGIRHVKLYEEIIHIPLIIHVPGFKGQNISEVVVESDIAPTLARLAGLKPWGKTHGKAIPFEGDGFRPSENRSVYSETRRHVNMTGVIEDGFKLIVDLSGNRTELYDLGLDPAERHNLASEEPGKVAELERKRREFYASDGAGKPGADEIELGAKELERLKDLGYVE